MSELEQWRPCPGYEGIYDVSSHGRIKRVVKGRVNGIPGTILKTSFDEKGYRIVCLSDGQKGTTKKVHRLVARAFLGDRSDLQVNHIDADKANAHVNNLEWVTPTENARHAHALGLHKAANLKTSMRFRHVGKKITLSAARVIRFFVRHGRPRASLAGLFNIHVMTVGEIVRNEIWAE